jgi:CBS domain-containing protein
MNAGDVMTHTVLTVSPETTLLAAARRMLDHHVSGLPVTDAAGAVVGMITEGDLLRRVELGSDGEALSWLRRIFVQGAAAEAYVRSHGRRVSEVMSEAPVSVTPATPLAHVVALMLRRGIKRVPVVDHGRLVGVVSRADLLHAVADALAREAPPLSDEAIRTQVAAELARQPWAMNVHITVEVADGRVVLRGTILDEHARPAVIVAVENVPGVTAVVDELAWVDPTSGVYLGVV